VVNYVRSQKVVASGCRLLRGAQRALARAHFFTTRITLLTWYNRAEINTFIVFELLGQRQGYGYGQGHVFISALLKGETI